MTRILGREEAAISFEAWLLLIGGLLLFMAFARTLVQRLPVTTTIVYLLLGIALGPGWLEVIQIDPVVHAAWLHRAAEVSVLISLFTVGMKLRLPVLDRRLRPALCLASVSMIVTVGLVTAAGFWLLHLPLGAAILLGGVLAPTDPVLASDVQIRNPQDRDKLRLTMTAEGGLNDGTAFPFVMLGLGLLGLHDLGAHGWRWWLVDGVWAVLGGLGIGAGIGYGVGRFVLRLGGDRGKISVLGEYLLLGLIGVSYGGAVLLHAYGFLAVFAAGVAVRAVERGITSQSAQSEKVVSDVASGQLPDRKAASDPKIAPAYFAGALLATNEQLEHVLEVALVLILGAVLVAAGVSFDALWFAPLLFLVIRPLAALPLLLVARFTPFEFGTIAWFGIRGIGSIYYLMYAVEKGLPPELADRLTSLTLTIVALSILVHGFSVTPLFNIYERRRTGRKRPPDPHAVARE